MSTEKQLRFVAWTMTIHQLQEPRTAGDQSRGKTVCGHAVPPVNKVGPIGYYENRPRRVCQHCQRKAAQ